MRLFRAHGLGNDYLLLEGGEALTSGLVQRLCNRHTGVGGDGVLEPFETSEADFGVRIHNPDGSIAEKSGNGLRIFALWVNQTTGRSGFSISTGFETVYARVGAGRIEVEMGEASFDPAAVPTTLSRPAIEHPLLAFGVELTVTAVGIGNPHCVHFCDDFDALPLPWRRLGAALECHQTFPNRTNVQFARQLGPASAALKIWERGAGETMASGSSACAVAATAVKLGLLPSNIPLKMVMAGGALEVTVSADYHLLLAGPVEVVGRFEVDPAWL